ncbi:hypothetical protein GZ77_16590 [Endozoicomonas montiporae]|uniref:Nucleoside phosphorylase domain-containing protein n=2 Tax=Endozoicomonas montiporae TaxID=1027273 RepID=A0A081N2L7_9GAMM|nr:hypothetical protein [Endozoicomonas montiporae]AMO54815.1 putative methylthioadenosine/S-adenosyl homocysteine nucleosidase [Endozoicomonas montiporae CL-33]KEQ12690.1 hypothetical protein GZ77_19595 [Endozoicomonas montiporae]KEQ13873.1 hypothetical protein GZ77_16590 [Endozoicomonas montiporae]
MQRITMIVAMKQEAASIIKHLNLSDIDMHDPVLTCQAFQGNYKGLDISLVVNGTDREYNVESVGTQPATITTLEAIRQFKPDLLINAGTCGAFQDKGSAIGDVYMGEKIRYFDRRIPLGEDYFAYGDGSYVSKLAGEYARQLGLKTAVVCTGNSLDMSPTDEAILREEPVVAKEMEAAAIAAVAKLYKTPLLAMKSVTDLMDEKDTTAEQFLANLTRASELLQQNVFRLLDLLSNQTKAA